MTIINRHDTDGIKSLLSKGEFGFDDYAAGGDQGRVYVGDGTSNVAISKKSEVDTKLDSSAYTASDVLTKVKTVDGAGSGLDADLLDGQQGSFYQDRSNHTGTQPLSTISNAGTAASKDVTTSPTDTTAGRLLKVGDFGVGASVYIGNTDLNTIVSSGFYRIEDANPNRPAGSEYGQLIVSRGVDTIYQQISGYTGRVWQRSGNPPETGGAGTWNPWQEFYHTGNILGTVSQSGGVPTGAIIERGSNVNGEYVKYADGTLICTHSFNITTSTGFSNVFGTSSGFSYRTIAYWVFPAIFITNPSISTMTQGVIAPVECTGLSTTQTGIVPYTTNNNTTVLSICTAIGRWF